MRLEHGVDPLRAWFLRAVMEARVSQQNDVVHDVGGGSFGSIGSEYMYS